MTCVLRVEVPHMSGPNMMAYLSSPLNLAWSTPGASSLMYAPPQSSTWSWRTVKLTMRSLPLFEISLASGAEML